MPASFVSSRPVLKLDGNEAPDLAQGLLSLSVTETWEGLCRCEMTLGNWGQSESDAFFQFFGRDILEFGRDLAVHMGEGTSQEQVFKGRIMALEGHFPHTRAPEVTVLAEDRFQDLRMCRRSRSYEDVSDGDVIEQIAREHGLTPDVSLAGPTHRVLAQLNQSDLAFIRERARAVDGEVWLRDNTLYAKARDAREENRISLTLGSELFEFNVLADLAGQHTSLVVSGWNIEGKEGISHEADENCLGAELSGLTGGGSILRDTVGERVARMVHQLPVNDAEVTALAEACYREQARRFVTGEGVAQGDGRIKVGTRLELEGLGPLFKGTYQVTETSHQFDDSNGYRTRFRVERPGIGSP